MAGPTLKDVLDAIVRLDKKTDARFVTLDAKVVALDANVDAHRKETAKAFADLDDELAKHSERTHRKLETRIERLERRTAPKKVSARPLRRR